MTWLRSAHLPFPALTEAFPHTADELFAGAWCWGDNHDAQLGLTPLLHSSEPVFVTQ